MPETHEILSTVTTTCIVVGGGPAGAVLSYMLARKGIDVMLLESHQDFDRDFRGDTLHPSIMEVMDELGIAEKLLQLPHTKISEMVAQTPHGSVKVADLHSLKTKFPYITFMPQERFLNFITSEAQKFPSFKLVLGARVEELIEEDGTVKGVQYRSKDGWHEVRAALTVGADGRFSRMRKASGLGDHAIKAMA
jgi:2-polyprenyl-6-methoxyphenol hydroxylase-like FAD-dependent oxidoreductase